MLSSIHPLGERGRGNRYGVTATAFAIGSVAGGAVVGALVGAIGIALPLSDLARLVLLAMAAVITLGFDLTGRRLPSLQRQVNEDWMHTVRGWVYGSGFGFQLGAGVSTYITAAAVVLWLGAQLAVDSIPLAMAIGAVFGLTRGLSIWTTRHITEPVSLQQLFRRLHSTAPTVRRIGVAVSGILTLATLALVAQAA